ncbi:hypothetical protein [Amycolatopsis sp. NPDC051071]|uniref:hypothetical protein n=1 Tax=Amycolatopsis sp. NPDC051071 TaxID=3154637 RepID=UPI003447DDD0
MLRLAGTRDSRPIPTLWVPDDRPRVTPRSVGGGWRSIPPARFPERVRAVAGGTLALLAAPVLTVGLMFTAGLVSCW